MLCDGLSSIKASAIIGSMDLGLGPACRMGLGAGFLPLRVGFFGLPKGFLGLRRGFLGLGRGFFGLRTGFFFAMFFVGCLV